ncbi:MAG TPA: transporter [Cyanobacteria bacterium UBA11162]|nr:transporter [Cyanobacteria bacterium UBA11162]
MPRKQQGWITFQSSDEERKLLEEYCQQCKRTKTEILRELLRSLNQHSPNQLQDASTPETKPVTQKIDYKALKISARNVLKGRIKRVIWDAVHSEITLEIAPGVELTSTITRASAEELNLCEGKEAYAVIKSSNVMIAQDE